MNRGPFVYEKSFWDTKFSVYEISTYIFVEWPPKEKSIIYIFAMPDIDQLIQPTVVRIRYIRNCVINMELDSALITKAVDAIIRHTNKISAVKSKNSLFEDFPKPIIVQVIHDTPCSC